jgi:hypothetical protein
LKRRGCLGDRIRIAMLSSTKHAQPQVTSANGNLPRSWKRLRRFSSSGKPEGSTHSTSQTQFMSFTKARLANFSSGMEREPRRFRILRLRVGRDHIARIVEAMSARRPNSA